MKSYQTYHCHLIFRILCISVLFLLGTCHKVSAVVGGGKDLAFSVGLEEISLAFWGFEFPVFPGISIFRHWTALLG